MNRCLNRNTKTYPTMKYLTSLLLALIFTFAATTETQARDHRHDRRHGNYSKYDNHRHDHNRGRYDSHRGDRHRHYGKPSYSKRHGNYYRSRGYYGSNYYGRRILIPGIGFVYVR